MFADLLDQNYKIRLITNNVLAVFSTNDIPVLDFLNVILDSKFKINNNNIVNSESVISTYNTKYNKYENIFRYIVKQNKINKTKVIEYISFFNINYILWLSFDQINKFELQILNVILQLSTNKPIIITDYFDDNPFKYKLYSLLFNIGLEDRLVIVPFRNISDAVSNSTCQCYVKEINDARIQTKFPVEYLNYEFKSNLNYYKISNTPCIYTNNELQLCPTNYKYTLYQLALIILYNIKLMLFTIFNWRTT